MKLKILTLAVELFFILFILSTAENMKVIYKYVPISNLEYNSYISSEPIKREFFGMHILDVNAQYHNLGYGSLRLWDTHTTWKDLETNKGTYNWTQLDNYVDFAESHNLELVYTLGQAPNWATPPNICITTDYNPYPPRNNQDWVDYITAVVNRYKGKINYYEVWNEPNDGQKIFWNGTMSRLAELTEIAYDTIHALDPNAKVLSPSFHQWDNALQKWQAFLDAGGINHFDILSIHLYVYPKQPEEMIKIVKMFSEEIIKRGMIVPVWNTETGYGSYYLNGILKNPDDTTNNDIMPDNLASAYIARIYLSNLLAGVDKCFYYTIESKWNRLRLVNPQDKNQVFVAGKAMKRLSDWLDGAYIKNISTENGVYIIIYEKNNELKSIIWTTDGRSIIYKISSQLKAITTENLLGFKSYCINGKIIVGNSPILVNSDIRNYGGSIK